MFQLSTRMSTIFCFHATLAHILSCGSSFKAEKVSFNSDVDMPVYLQDRTFKWKSISRVSDDVFCIFNVTLMSPFLCISGWMLNSTSFVSHCCVSMDLRELSLLTSSNVTFRSSESKTNKFIYTTTSNLSTKLFVNDTKDCFINNKHCFICMF